MPLLIALAISLVAEVLVGFLASRLSAPAAVALSLWRRFCRRRRKAGSLRSALDDTGSGDWPPQLRSGLPTVGGRAWTRVPRSEVHQVDRRRPRPPERVAGWTIDLSCGAVRQETDSKVKRRDEPHTGAQLVEDVRSRDRRSRSHSWSFSVDVSSRRTQAIDDYVVSPGLDNGESATLAERLDGSRAGIRREGGGAP